MQVIQWRHNGHDSVSNHQPRECLLNRLIRCRSKKTSKLRVTDLCAGNSPETGDFPAQRASNAENVSIGWRHHENVCITIHDALHRYELKLLRPLRKLLWIKWCNAIFLFISISMASWVTVIVETIYQLRRTLFQWETKLYHFRIFIFQNYGSVNLGTITFLTIA